MKKQNEKFKQKRLKGASGITLIALVITIIVLLILAAVSIATLTGDNGILTKANTAKTTNDSAQAEEEMKLLLADWQLEKRSNSGADLGEFLNSKKAKGELDKVTDNKDGSYIIERNGYEATISDEDGLGEITKKEPELPLQLLNPGDTAKVTQKDNYVDVNGDKATIPEGFTVSVEDNTIDTGLVVTAPDGSEFVWVPVPKAIATTSPAEPAKDTTEKAMAVKVGEDDYRGVLYNFNGSGDSTSSSVMTGCTTTNFDNNTSYREPSIVKDYDNDTNLKVIGLTQAKFKKEMEDDYKEMIDKVEKYKGFYVGRYETSINGNNVASVKGVNPMSATDDNNQTWYGMYEKQKKYAEKVNKKDISKIVGSSMIWGSQWDSMMNWMLTSDTERAKVTKNNTRHEKTTTGSTPEDVMKKIYDLENNVFEYCLESYYTYIRVIRGNGSSSPSDRYLSGVGPTGSSDIAGSRLTLYVK